MEFYYVFIIEKLKLSCSCNVHPCVFARMCLDRPYLLSGFIKKFPYECHTEEIIFLEVIILQMLVFSIYACVFCTLGGILFSPE